MALQHSFAGKRVLVTGGGMGLGLDIVKRFYDDGAIVFVIDRVQQLLDNAKAEMPNLNTVCIDLSDWDTTYAAVRAMAPLDHLVNNAGVLRTGFLLDVTPQDFDLTVGVNMRGLICVSQAFVKGIIETGGNGGTIVNMSSVSDRVGFPGGGVYAATKSAVVRLTMAMGLEFAEYNVRTNCVNPTFVATEMVKSIPEDVVKKSHSVIERNPIKEPLQPKDVTDAVCFLSSSLSDKVNGTSLVVDGGLRTA